MEGFAVSKFFVSNLPEGCTPWELSSFMHRFGEVSKSYVAKKRDKHGNRFGFVSFKSVRDWKELELSLNGANMGGFKLKVNIARFALENSGVGREHERSRVSGGQGGINKQQGDIKFAANRDGRSYSNVVKPVSAGVGSSGSEKSDCNGKVEKVVEVSDKVVAFDDLHRRAVVGRTVDLDTLIYFDRLLSIGKVRYVKIHYLGGLSLFISFGCSEEAETFLRNKDLWGPWFSKLDMWEGQVLAVERLAWIRVQGVLIHIMDSEVLRKIGNLYGKTLFVPKDVGDESDLSVICMGVLAGNDQRIKEFVSLRWKDKIFRIWVSEEENEWVPDCISSFGSESSPTAKEAPVTVSSGKEAEKSVDEGDDVSVSKVLGENTSNNFSVKGGSAFHSLAAEDSASHFVGCEGGGETLFKSQKSPKQAGPKTFKRRKGKATGSSSVGSPLESRPKKRVRAQVEKEGLYGMDDLMQNGPYSFQNVSAMEDQGTGDNENVVIEASIVLNRRNTSSEDQQVFEGPPE
ncbi:putative RNA recognition motif domain, nucleotide-binding alpha-beta plait domain superfamily [Helianthus annuus]|nr:putative RNA recognition motif domain, nucleotide-binding alpha-beta plait domain superfamily [Helianthus annuus]